MNQIQLRNDDHDGDVGDGDVFHDYKSVGGEKVDLRLSRSQTMSRTSTDPEICKRR